MKQTLACKRQIAYDIHDVCVHLNEFLDQQMNRFFKTIVTCLYIATLFKSLNEDFWMANWDSQWIFHWMPRRQETSSRMNKNGIFTMKKIKTFRRIFIICEDIFFHSRGWYFRHARNSLFRHRMTNHAQCSLSMMLNIIMTMPLMGNTIMVHRLWILVRIAGVGTRWRNSTNLNSLFQAERLSKRQTKSTFRFNWFWISLFSSHFS